MSTFSKSDITSDSLDRFSLPFGFLVEGIEKSFFLQLFFIELLKLINGLAER